MPPAIAALPKDDRGYPVPWFVAWPNGRPDFRCMDSEKFARAVMEKRCWVCGEKLNPRQHVFVIGPMCMVNLITSEPPSHEECAVFSVRNCPFLTKPAAHYRTANIPAGAEPPPGLFLDRNPGVSCLYYCRGYQLIRPGVGKPGWLFSLPGPAQVRFWREGRKATRAEIVESINGGLATLKQVAAKDGPDAELALRQSVNRAMKLVPAS
jgi:hypothetical protein